MRVLVACEFSGVVRGAFRRIGHDAWSCDLLPTDDGSPFHLQGDVLLEIQRQTWDLLIAFPPCTHLAASGARWFKFKKQEQQEAMDFVLALSNARAGRIAIENPIGIISSKWRKPDQIIHPCHLCSSCRCNSQCPCQAHAIPSPASACTTLRAGIGLLWLGQSCTMPHCSAMAFAMPGYETERRFHLSGPGDS